MKKFLRNSTVLILLFCSSLAHAQEIKGKVVPVKLVPVKAEVVGVLEGNEALAILRIMEVDSANEIGLKKGEEVLVNFRFTNKTEKKEPATKAIKGRDIINARLAGNYNKQTHQYDYRVFEHKVVSEFVELKKEEKK